MRRFSAKKQRDTDDDEDTVVVQGVMDELRRRSRSTRKSNKKHLSQMALSCQQNPATSLFSVDGEIIPAFPVEINTDEIGSIMASTRTGSSTSSAQQKELSGVHVDVGENATNGQEKSPQRKSTRRMTRFTYNESLQQDIIENFDMVRVEYNAAENHYPNLPRSEQNKTQTQKQKKKAVLSRPSNSQLGIQQHSPRHNTTQSTLASSSTSTSSLSFGNTMSSLLAQTCASIDTLFSKPNVLVKNTTACAQQTTVCAEERLVVLGEFMEGARGHVDDDNDNDDDDDDDDDDDVSGGGDDEDDFTDSVGTRMPSSTATCTSFNSTLATPSPPPPLGR